MLLNQGIRFTKPAVTQSYQGISSHKWSRTTRTHKGAVCVYPVFCTVLHSLQQTLKRWLPSSVTKSQTQNQMQNNCLLPLLPLHTSISDRDMNTNCLSLDVWFRTAGEGREGVAVSVPGGLRGEKQWPSMEDPAERKITAAPGERRAWWSQVRSPTTTSTDEDEQGIRPGRGTRTGEAARSVQMLRCLDSEPRVLDPGSVEAKSRTCQDSAMSSSSCRRRPPSGQRRHSYLEAWGGGAPEGVRRLRGREK